MRINLNHLYQFYMTAKEGSIKKASKVLHVTESTISKQIKDLEEYIEIYLFRRINNHLELTPMGEELRARSEEVFKLVEEIEFLLGKKTPGVENKLCIGAPALLYPYLIRFFDMDFYDLDLTRTRFCCLGDKDLRTELETCAIDLAVIDKPLPLEDYFGRKIVDVPLCLVGSANYQHLAGNFPASINNVNKIVLNSDSKIQEDLDHYLSTHGVQPNRRIIVDSFETAREAAIRGCGVAVLPYPSVQNEIDDKSLFLLSQVEELSLSIWLVALKSRIEDPVVQRAFKHVSPQDFKKLFELRK